MHLNLKYVSTFLISFTLVLSVQAQDIISSTNIYTSKGSFTFEIPSGWRKISNLSLQAKGFICGFTKLDQKDFSAPYMLVKKTSKRLPSTEIYQKYLNTLTSFEDFGEFVEVINSPSFVANKHNSYYIKKYDTHVWVFDYGKKSDEPSISIMVKRIQRHGSLTMHFYYNTYIEVDSNVLSIIQETLKFDKSFRYD